MTTGGYAECAAPGLPVLRGSWAASGKISMVDREPNPRLDWPRARLRKHSDYQRVYKAGRKQSSPSMSYFFRLRAESELDPAYAGPRIGLTVGRVLGKAVDRNRIKRRMREVSRINLELLPALTDVVLHPRRIVLEMDFAKLEREVAKIFSTISAQVKATQVREAGVRA